MTYSVYQHWDPLKVCIVGRSYPPEFYKFITNHRILTVMQRIARETEEDYQKLISLLESFGVEILRPNIKNSAEFYTHNGKILPPPMCPRDFTAIVGDTFYIDQSTVEHKWEIPTGHDWPLTPATNYFEVFDYAWKDIINQVKKNVKSIQYNQGVNTATLTRVGKNLFLGTSDPRPNWELNKIQKQFQYRFSDYRCNVLNIGGHSDGTFFPVKPRLIISLKDIPTYSDTFPGWEVIYLPGQSWDKVDAFLKLKKKNKGKWWVPSEELNDDFTNFVEEWISHWVGYVEETVFDVNMLVINEQNVIVNNYNKQVFDAFKRHNITPHIINFRHRYFWDGGIHCITSDLHREGTMQDYFPDYKETQFV